MVPLHYSNSSEVNIGAIPYPLNSLFKEETRGKRQSVVLLWNLIETPLSVLDR
uniref:Uncharacterized protein n=1 Tax=Anguilla anguilla TaxID=7936 RepID=A0A0E9X0T4_ANGAN